MMNLYQNIKNFVKQKRVVCCVKVVCPETVTTPLPLREIVVVMHQFKRYQDKVC